MTVEAEAPLQVVELNFSSTSEATIDKIGDREVVWKDILPEGKFPMLPGMGKKKVPFEVVPTGESSLKDRRISMSDLIESYDQQAFPSGVTIPDGHPKMDAAGNIVDSALNNTGYVSQLRVVKKDDKHVLQAALGFTEPDAAGKVKRGTVPNVSAGVLFNWLRKDNQKRFRCALNHVALTKIPWMNLEPFQKVFASDDILKDQEFEIVLASFADDGAEDNSGDNGTEIVWNEQDGSNWIREALTRALTPDRPSIEEGMPYTPRPDYYVEDVADAKNIALVTEWYKGDRTKWVIPFTRSGDEVTPAPATRWVEGKEALVAASDHTSDDEGVEFSDLTPESIIDKLGVKLSDMLEGEKFAVEKVSFDNRCHIRNKETGQGFEADFRILADGGVMLDDPSDWGRTDKVTPEQADGTQPSSAPVNKVTPLFDESTIEGRVAAARQRRRQKIAGTSH